jgi:hypothetical protein
MPSLKMFWPYTNINFGPIFGGKVKWRKEYNTVRPHSSLGYKPPAPEFIEPIPSFYATH